MDLTKAQIKRISANLSDYQKTKVRLYEHEEQKGLSVSDCCGIVVPHYLQNWFRNKTKKEIEKVKDTTASVGSLCHTLPEKQAKGEDVTPPEELKQWYADWNKTQKKYDISAEMSEVMVFSKRYAYGGQIDRVGAFNGKRCIIDFKTGHYSHINLWKTEAYRQAYIEMTGDSEVGAVVLHLPRPDLVRRGHEPKHYSINRHDTVFLSFLCAYQDVCMLYYTDLIKLGMSAKDVYALKPFLLYEQLKADELLNGLAKENK